MVVLVCGPPGSGKTTITNRVRDELAIRGHEFRVLHSDDFSGRTYERLYRRVLGTDDDWLVDGTFYRRCWRERFRDLGGVRVVLVWASLETCLERDRDRDGISDRGVRIVHAEFDTPRADLVLDTDELPIEQAVGRLLEAISEWRDA